jgi:hypothetical protein
MIPLKSAIFREVRNTHEESLGHTDDQLDQLIFLHTGESLRLSFKGFLLLKNIFTVYSFEVPYTLKAKHQIGLAKMEYPYYVTHRRLILFSEMDAMVVKLCGGIEGFLETCFNTDRQL